MKDIKIEKEINLKLIEIWNLFVKLEKTHPAHDKDFSDGIHKCQYVIMHKILQRTRPKEYPKK